MTVKQVPQTDEDLLLERIEDAQIECPECFEPMRFVEHHLPLRVSLFTCDNDGQGTEIDWDDPEESL